jgi:hypothetical protein
MLVKFMQHKDISQEQTQVNSTYQIQRDTITSIDDYDIEKVESIILQKKGLIQEQ